MRRLFVITIAMVLLGSCAGYAQSWPTRPVRIIAPQAPGGGADTVARVIASYLSAALHRNFFVEDRPGASGMIGSALVAHSAPDGYNFVISGMPSHVVGPASRANPPYDPVKDFTHVAYVGGAPLVLLINPSLGVKSFSEFIALAKSTKDGLNYGTPGVNSLGNLAGEYLADKAKITLRQIPYKGGSQVINDLLSGQVKVGFMSLAPAVGQIRAGTLLPLAVTSSKRIADFPNLPTFKELGYGELVVTAWWAFSGPAGLPHAIVRKLHDLVDQAIQTPSVRQRLEREYMEIRPLSQEQTARFVEAEVNKWGPIARAALSSHK
jgi:tripartite-type tricarboxylate transporter receptor subunit TctC